MNPSGLSLPISCLCALLASCSSTSNTAGAGASGGGTSGETSTQGGGAARSSAGASGALGGVGGTSAGGVGGNRGAVGGASGGSTQQTGIKIQGRTLLVDGTAYHIQGVDWNPVAKGATQPADYAGLGPLDIPLMKAAGINTLRTYAPLLDLSVLDSLYAAGIRVLNGVYSYGGDPASAVTARVNAVKAHPAILGWVVGNEWNYNGLYVNLSVADAQARVSEVATLIKMADATHPVISAYGEVPSAAVLAAMPNIDIWGINAYRGISFGDLFTVWQSRSTKPMFLSEYGADAYNANLPGYDPTSQALADEMLTQELLDHSSARTQNGVTLGGTIFEWADEWWKAGSPATQEVGGSAPGGGPYPDQTFNEEYWGLVDVDRNPRAAYTALAKLFGR